MKNIREFCFGFCLPIVLFSSCESFVDTEAPAHLINSLNVFNQQATAVAAVTEMYGNAPGISPAILAGLSADELTLFDGVSDIQQLHTYRNQLTHSSYMYVDVTPWSIVYKGILSTNSSLEGLSLSTSLSSVVKQQLLGECYFMRAFNYFYLVNLYGDLPLVLTSDPNINNGLPRASKEKVYEQIVEDLLKAQELLNQAYVNKDMVPYVTNEERVRPNKAAATALLSRAHLYMGPNHYDEAETYATDVINRTSDYELLPLNDVFLKNSKEAIWQLQPTLAGRNTGEGYIFVLPESGPDTWTSPVYMSESLLSSFESGDERALLGNWVNNVTATDGVTYHFPFKYKVKASSTLSEYLMVLRISEQYLIRAEARAHQNKLTGPNGAASDLNMIRERAGLPPTTATTQAELLDAILRERRVELFTEWGHRWLDLKRTGKVDDVMEVATGEKGGTWESYQQWYPIPFQDIERGPNLKQNPGYE